MLIISNSWGGGYIAHESDRQECTGCHLSKCCHLPAALTQFLALTPTTGTYPAHQHFPYSPAFTLSDLIYPPQQHLPSPAALTLPSSAYPPRQHLTSLAAHSMALAALNLPSSAYPGLGVHLRLVSQQYSHHICLVGSRRQMEWSLSSHRSLVHSRAIIQQVQHNVHVT